MNKGIFWLLCIVGTWVVAWMAYILVLSVYATVYIATH